LIDIQVNGEQLTFINCDGNPSSYLAIFPNVNGLTPQWNYIGGYYYAQIINAIRLSVVSLPVNYFMFWETGFGGCGTLVMAGDGGSNADAIGAAIGFR